MATFALRSIDVCTHCSLLSCEGHNDDLYNHMCRAIEDIFFTSV